MQAIVALELKEEAGGRVSGHMDGLSSWLFIVCRDVDSVVGGLDAVGENCQVDCASHCGVVPWALGCLLKERGLGRCYSCLLRTLSACPLCLPYNE